MDQQSFPFMIEMFPINIEIIILKTVMFAERIVNQIVGNIQQSKIDKARQQNTLHLPNITTGFLSLREDVYVMYWNSIEQENLSNVQDQGICCWFLCNFASLLSHLTQRNWLGRTQRFIVVWILIIALFYKRYE